MNKYHATLLPHPQVPTYDGSDLVSDSMYRRRKGHQASRFNAEAQFGEKEKRNLSQSENGSQVID